MIETPQIIQTQEQLSAMIHITVPRDQIQEVMGPGITEVRAAIRAQGIKPTGAWFTYHLKMSPDIFDFEVGIPVAAAVKPAGRVRPGKLPEARVARTVFHGDYEGLGDAWGEFVEWIVAQGHTPRADLWESYVTGPEANPDPAAWRTQLNRPLTS